MMDDTYPDRIATALNELSEWAVDHEPRNTFVEGRDFQRMCELKSRGAEEMTYIHMERYFRFADHFPRLRFPQDIDFDGAGGMRVEWWHPEDKDKTRFVLVVSGMDADAAPHVYRPVYEGEVHLKDTAKVERWTDKTAAEMAALITAYNCDPVGMPVDDKLDVGALICEEDEHDSEEWVVEEEDE